MNVLETIKKHLTKNDYVIKEISFDYKENLHLWEESPEYITEDYLHVAPKIPLEIKLNTLNKTLWSLHPSQLKTKPQITIFRNRNQRLYYGSLLYIFKHTSSKQNLEKLVKITLYPNKNILKKTLTQDDKENYSISSMKIEMKVK